ncbi:MAG: HD domain-containing protein [Clostridia bacterium]|nr:HD domain-containing protein [Clostridia bacterium]
MITKPTIETIYESASIQRWNDHIRPWTGFTELDKQAHKMFYAYVLAKCEGDGVDMQKLVEGGIFEFFHRSILTDIKPPIYHQLIKEKGHEIDEWVLDQLRSDLGQIGGGFFARMERYFREKEYSELEKKILKAAHYEASCWEFEIIYSLNHATFGIEQIKQEMRSGLASCDTFRGFREFAGSKYLQDFLSLIGKLRYQQRWAKAVRMPSTYVMGHMLVVAILSYFSTLETGCEVCPKRLVNNFFGGLFHDLPEVLTRDIVSPVKASVEGLGHIINEIEAEQMEKVIYPLLPPNWHSELKYFTTNEFDSKIILNNEVKKITSDEINKTYNDDYFNPMDGQIIRACDHLSAYIEAYLSLSYGIRSEQISGGYNQLTPKYKDKVIGGVDFGKMFGYFKI